jgi:glutamine synthetase
MMTELTAGAIAPDPRGAACFHVVLPDIDGGLRERRISRETFSTIVRSGGSFCNVLHKWDAVDNVFGNAPFESETVAVDEASYRPYPFEPNAAWVVTDFTGPSAETSTRNVLIRQIEKATKLGFSIQAAFEFEWLVFEENAASLRAKNYEGLKPFAVDNRCWDTLSGAANADLIAALDAVLCSADVTTAGLGMELGKGCMEATLHHTSPLRAADDAVFFKAVTKAFFRQRGMSACFMAQSDATAPGLSGHIQLSMLDASGKNIFAAGPGELTEAGQHFVGGVLKLLPEALALSAHTVNAYRRMTPGNWAPRTATWSRGGYTTAIRAVTEPLAAPRLEFRIPAADVNPWLGLGFFLGAGLWGIANRIEPPEAVRASGNEAALSGLAALPRDLFTAVQALVASDTAAVLFGQQFIDRFVQSRLHEVEALRRAVSVAEKSRYFESA